MINAPHKRLGGKLGQNFILDDNIHRELVKKSGVTPDMMALEIGAGLGGLTRALADVCARVISIEIDRGLESDLRVIERNHPNVEIIMGDALTLDFAKLIGDAGHIALVANLPYCITTEILLKAFRFAPAFDIIACMTQKEVAEKWTRERGSQLAVWAHGIGEPRIEWILPPTVFVPPPSIDSAFVVQSRHERPPFAPDKYADINRVMNAAFLSRRKTLRNNLKSTFHLTGEDTNRWLLRADIDGDRRAEELTAQEFARLSECR
ncbi:ribosomal RNA small subunit methyltransferase A [Clostridia bacterium]|nr:ribosomal RNA small subunit methyltransferase A [Clostridia bacterium]